MKKIMKLKLATLKSLVVYVTSGYNVSTEYMLKMLVVWFMVLLHSVLYVYILVLVN